MLDPSFFTPSNYIHLLHILKEIIIETDEIIKNLSLSADVVFSEICDTEEKARKVQEVCMKKRLSKRFEMLLQLTNKYFE